MQDARVGSLVRVLRIRRGWRQRDLARAACVSASVVSEIERGRIDSRSLRTLRAVAAALGATVDLDPRWRGGDADRIVNEGHTRLHESVARHLDSLGGWLRVPEVAFSVGGERGVIDILAFHPATRSLLLIELKTELTDLARLLEVTSRRQRLARPIALAQGWTTVDTVSTWVVVAESTANRRRASRFRTMLRGALPADGHAVRPWLVRPTRRIAALSFWSDPTLDGVPRRIAPTRRVRLPRPARAAAPTSGPVE